MWNERVGDDIRPVACVLRAVRAGVSAEQLRAVIDMYASEGGCAYTPGTYEARRAAAVNSSPEILLDDLPLNAAFARGRGDLIGVLLAAGADARAAFAPNCSPLAVAIYYGQTETLRALLRSGLYDVNAPLRYEANEDYVGGENEFRGGYDRAGRRIVCRAVHLAIVPPGCPCIPPRLDALEVLVREFGADVNTRDHNRRSPIYWLRDSYFPFDTDGALDALLALGADLEARDRWGRTPLCDAVVRDGFRVARQLLSRGASADALDRLRVSPLMHACRRFLHDDKALIPRLVRASSRETRRLVRPNSGKTALDYLLVHSHSRNPPWYHDSVRELLRSGVPVHPDNAHLALAYAARLGARLGALAAASARLPPPWQAHEAAVGLALDFQERRDVDEGVRAREARVAELERALLAEKEEAEGQEESDGEEEEEEGSGKEEEGSGKEEGSGSGSGDGGA